jgi:pimeloyl-ACP methyl ester carboxylesterase
MHGPVITDLSIDIDGVSLAVRRIAGEASPARPRPTLVFLHDSLGCIETWRDFPEALVERTGLDAIVYDRQGYGRSAPFTTDARTVGYLADEASALFRLLDTLSIDTALLFGHSDGGSIALIAAAEQPGRIAGVITEGAHVFVEEETLAGIREARSTLATTDLAARLARYHGDKVAGLTSAWIDTWLSPPFRDWNIEAALPAARCAALIIQGEKDEYGTRAQVDAIISGFGGDAEPLLIPEIGHTPHREARATVLDASAAFVAEIVRRGSPVAAPTRKA